MIGSGEKLELNADISNSGEDAFNAMLFLQIPRGINFIKANYSNSADSLLCSPPTNMNNRTLQCGVGNPLPAGTDVSWKNPGVGMKPSNRISEVIVFLSPLLDDGARVPPTDGGQPGSVLV